jgi:hypothetical protein
VETEAGRAEAAVLRGGGVRWWWGGGGGLAAVGLRRMKVEVDAGGWAGACGGAAEQWRWRSYCRGP